MSSKKCIVIRGYKKQHIIPETYLKHFSENEDGKDLFIINLRDKYQRKIYSKNKGDSCFWIENYYDTIQLKNRKTLEIVFNKLVENSYDKLINEVKKENPIKEKWIKDELLLFIFFSLFRSPGRRDAFEQKLRLKKWINETKGKSEKFEGNIDKETFVKELHLNEMINDERMYQNVDSICTYLGIKNWTIIIAPENSYWMTSDDPCVEIKFNDDNSFTAGKRWDFENLETMYIPLTKKYCLLIESYEQDSDVKLNLNTDSIKFKKASKKDILLFNRFSYVTMSKLLIGPNEQTFTDLAYELEKVTTTNK